MSLRRQLNSFKYAFRGIGLLLRDTPNARVHLAASILAVSAGLFFKISSIEWCAVLFAIGLVTGMEAMNSALETLTDLVSPDFHPLAGKAKDLAAGAVLLAALAAFAIGLLVFLPKVIDF